MLVDINNMKYRKDLVDYDFSSKLQLEHCHDMHILSWWKWDVSFNELHKCLKKHQKQLSQEPLSPLLKFQNFITFRCFHRGAIFCFPFFFGFPGVYLQELLRAAELGALGISSMKPQVGGSQGWPQNHRVVVVRYPPVVGWVGLVGRNPIKITKQPVVEVEMVVEISSWFNAGFFISFMHYPRWVV